MREKEDDGDDDDNRLATGNFCIFIKLVKKRIRDGHNRNFSSDVSITVVFFRGCLTLLPKRQAGNPRGLPTVLQPERRTISPSSL